MNFGPDSGGISNDHSDLENILNDISRVFLEILMRSQMFLKYFPNIVEILVRFQGSHLC